MPHARTHLLILASLTLGLASACSSSGTSESQRPAESLALADFADDTAVVRRPVRTTEPEPITPTTPPLNATVGAPTIDPEAPATGERLVVDRVVGQINGRPVYAEEFFRESQDYWRALSKRRSAREWSAELQKDTTERLYTLVREELLLAEFRASLTAQQRQGILAFVENLREGFVKDAGGSEREANRRSLEEFGVDLDTNVKNQAEREFILEQLRRSILARVQVSSRDIELYYKRNIRDFQPLPVAIVRQIRIDADNDERRAEVEAALNATPIPESLGTVTRIPLEEGGQTATTFYGVPDLNNAAQRLTPGEHAGPITVGTSLWWIRLDALESPEQKSLYDAQLEIEQTIRQQRLIAEESRYFERLLERSNVSEIQDMITGLLEYAIDRLYTPEDQG